MLEVQTGAVWCGHAPDDAPVRREECLCHISSEPSAQDLLHHLQRQNLYFCTSKASNLSTGDAQTACPLAGRSRFEASPRHARVAQ